MFSYNNYGIINFMQNIFIGGSDTPSATIIWSMTELIKNPSIMKKAQEEVRSLVRSKGKVEESDLCKLYYLKCVITEVMRLHPIVPLLSPREAMKCCTINNYDIPPGTMLLVNTFAISRDTNVWENPDKFDPERFSDRLIEFDGLDFKLIAFGAGRKKCPDMKFGLLVVELALANLLCYFNWELPIGVSADDIDTTEAMGIVVHKKNDIFLVAKRYRGAVGE